MGGPGSGPEGPSGGGARARVGFGGDIRAVVGDSVGVGVVCAGVVGVGVGIRVDVGSSDVAGVPAGVGVGEGDGFGAGAGASVVLSPLGPGPVPGAAPKRYALRGPPSGGSAPFPGVSSDSPAGVMG